jgi:hypothetical protein
MGILPTKVRFQWYDTVTKEGIAVTETGTKILLNFELDAGSDLIARNIESGTRLVAEVIGGISNRIRLG